MNHSETSIIFVEASKVATLAKAVPKIKDNVKTVVYFGDADASTVSDVESKVRFCVICCVAH